MANNISDIESALIQGFLSADIIDSDRIAYEYIKFDTDGDAYCEVSFSPTQPIVSTLGSGGMNDVYGVFQIIICAPTNNGGGRFTSNGYCDKIEDFFIAGREFVYNNTCVKILSTGRGSAFVIDNYYRVPVSVTWVSKLQRKTF